MSLVPIVISVVLLAPAQVPGPEASSEGSETPRDAFDPVEDRTPGTSPDDTSDPDASAADTPSPAPPVAQGTERPVPPEQPRALEVAPASESELPPSGLHATPARAAEFRREGGFVGFGLGVTNCNQPDCFDIVLGGVGHLEFGYRLGLAALVLSGSLGGASLSPPTELSGLRGTALFVDVGVGIELFPVRRGRVDPFIAATLGYSRMHWKLVRDGQSGDVWYSRGGLRLGTGLNIYLSEQAALGPRVDLMLPFLGQLCSRNPSQIKSCDPVSDLISQGVDAYEKRANRRSLGKPWAATLNLHLMF